MWTDYLEFHEVRKLLHYFCLSAFLLSWNNISPLDYQVNKDIYGYCYGCTEEDSPKKDLFIGEDKG